LRHLIKLVRPPITPKKKPKKLAQRPKQSYLKNHINKKAPCGAFYFGVLGARGLAGVRGFAGAFTAVTLGLGIAFGLDTGVGFASTTDTGTSTLYGTAALISNSS
jgi:hypothetical protein